MRRSGSLGIPFSLFPDVMKLTALFGIHICIHYLKIAESFCGGLKQNIKDCGCISFSFRRI